MPLAPPTADSRIRFRREDHATTLTRRPRRPNRRASHGRFRSHCSS